ncbi:MAG: hypothetical protein LBR75_00505 [Prevotellaceae bacterium]|jgi:hypothetical protein|nr:hypothetical protein [Prevotellaceae bacterium]
MKTVNRQAVVLIHGIGEQRPIETLRGFVEGIAKQSHKNKQAKEEKTIFWDKPDPVSGNYETRRMTMESDRGQDRPKTDFYEFYWAHNMRNTKFSHFKDWLFRIIFRRYKNVSKRLRFIYLLIWFLLLTLLAVIAVYGISWVVKTIHILSSGLIGFVIAAIFGIISYYLITYLGDAGRYLDPSPDNIAERQAIREDGMKLLKNLHKPGKYDRIIIIGHSLGSVIGYDLVKLLWNEYYKSFDEGIYAHSHRKKFDDKQVYCSEKVRKKLDEKHKELDEKNGETLNKYKEALNEYQEAQTKSYQYLQAIGNKWLITDLLTIGSPLTHAGYLFVHEKNGLFEKLKEQGEYPTCPPTIQKKKPSDSGSYRDNIDKSKAFRIDSFDYPLRAKHFNHSSPFAVTKWTNIYYQSDFIGGPLRDVFGSGIKDIEKEIVRNKDKKEKKKKHIWRYITSHVLYWDFENPDNILCDLCNILKVKNKLQTQ